MWAFRERDRASENGTTLAHEEIEKQCQAERLIDRGEHGDPFSLMCIGIDLNAEV